MKRILVTGGAGFIGSHLVDALIGSGKEVTVLDNFEPQVHQGKKPDYLNKNARYIEGDIRDEASLKKAFEEVDSVYHFASKVGVGQSMYEIKEYISQNTYGTAVFLEHIIKNKLNIKKLVVASSMSIYGEGSYECGDCKEISLDMRNEKDLKKQIWEPLCSKCGKVLKKKPTPETKRLYPTSVYAVSKKDQEELSLITGSAYKIPTVALRFFNVYGPRQSLSNPYTGACAIFSSRIKNNASPMIYEDGQQSRDFVDVRDVVRANMLVMEDQSADYQSFNVGTGKASTILEVAKTLASLYDRKIEPEVTNKFRAGDIRHCIADISRIKGLGFKPEIELEDGLRDLVRWGYKKEAADKMETADKQLNQFKLKF